MPFARVVLAGVVFLPLAGPAPAWAQGRGEDSPPADRTPGAPPASPAGDTGPLPSLRADPLLVRKFDAARDLLRTGAWAEAAHLLQELLDTPEDALLAVKRAGADGREIACWTGVRAEAARLLGTLPAPGRDSYARTYGPRARTLLTQARRDGDLELVEEVARHYPHTAAGAEAAVLLGAYHLDRAHVALAAVWFGRLLDRPDADGLPPATLFHAALAFRRTGDTAAADRAWARLAAKAPGGLRLGDRGVKLAELRKELDQAGVPADAPPAPPPEGLPALETRWTRPTTHETGTRGWLQAAVQCQEDRNEPVLPGAVPVAAAGLIVFRSYRGVQAVDPRTGEGWEAASDWSIDTLITQPRYAAHLESWFNSYREGSPNVVFGNGVLGTLSTDGARVYAVDDLAIPAYRSVHRFGPRWAPQEPAWPDFGPGLTDAVYYSRLLALDAASGSLAWAVGGRGGDQEAGELSDCYFLGPPLPLDHRLYVLAEKNNELSLVCLSAADGALVWRQPLALAPTRLLLDPGRHIHAARPVYGDGLLVCPTNAGVVVAVDLLTRGLAWAYTYETEALTQSEPAEGRRGRATPPHTVAEWTVPATVIQDGRVVVAAPDERSVHCLSLRDGSLLWKVGRAADDRYVAGVIDGKVLVVGKQSCRALDLEDGKQLWQLETGLPCGHGVAAGHVYYLPLREAGRDEEPAVYAIDVIDVTAGAVLAHTPWPRKDVPGNLLFRDGDIISQTALGVTAYRPRHDGGK
jgi:outer membrane protein assembly factor BamB